MIKKGFIKGNKRSNALRKELFDFMAAYNLKHPGLTAEDVWLAYSDVCAFTLAHLCPEEHIDANAHSFADTVAERAKGFLNLKANTGN